MPSKKPYYDHDGITIYHGDCREILPSLGQVDLAITDPPYGIEFQSRYRSTGKTSNSGPRASSYRFPKIKGDSEDYTDVIEKLINMASRATYVCTRWDVFSSLPMPKSLLAWVKDSWSAGDLEHEHGKQWEAICFYPGPDHKFVKRIPDVIHAKRTLNKHHPTEKPVKLFSKLIAANNGDLILDPFMGSGSVLIAAKALGKKAIGIEIEEKYCEVAVKRLLQNKEINKSISSIDAYLFKHARTLPCGHAVPEGEHEHGEEDPDHLEMACSLGA